MHYIIYCHRIICYVIIYESLWGIHASKPFGLTLLASQAGPSANFLSSYQLLVALVRRVYNASWGFGSSLRHAPIPSPPGCKQWRSIAGLCLLLLAGLFCAHVDEGLPCCTCRLEFSLLGADLRALPLPRLLRHW